MKKRILAAILAGTTAMAMFSGCGSNNNNNNDSTKVDESTADPNAVMEVNDYSKYVTIGDYKGLELNVGSATVTDDELKARKDTIIGEKTTQEHITDRKTADGDKIHLMYTGYLDDEPFQGGATGSSGTDYTIGGNYIKDLNDQLIGLECGKEYSLDCKFPDDYGNADLAGKMTVFKVQVEYIYGKDIVPEWTDDFVNEYTEGKYTNTADYEKKLKEDLYASNLETQKANYEAEVWKKVIANSKIDSYPEDKLNESYNDYYEYYAGQYSSMASYYSTTYEEILELNGMTEDTLKEGCKARAEAELDYILISTMIAKQENIVLTQAEYDKEIAEVVKQYNYDSAAAFEKDYGKEYVIESFIFRKVTDFLTENNKMNEVDPTEAPETTAKDDVTEEAETTVADETTAEEE